MICSRYSAATVLFGESVRPFLGLFCCMVTRQIVRHFARAGASELDLALPGSFSAGYLSVAGDFFFWAHGDSRFPQRTEVAS